MLTTKIDAGSKFPDIEAKTRDGRVIPLLPSTPSAAEGVQLGDRWSLIIVYRGKHCPICTKWLNELQSNLAKLHMFQVDIVAVSADSSSQLDEHLKDGIKGVTFPVLSEISIEDMKRLGLYLSSPMDDNETDHVFSEPGLFLVNHNGEVQIAEIANSPFIRPDIETLFNGIEYIRENGYPIRGTYTD